MYTQSMIIQREAAAELTALAKTYPIVTVTGPRQAGKTTLIQSLFPDKPYFNFEDPDTRDRVLADPRSFFNQHPDGAVLDEIQKAPILISYLQGIVDHAQKPGLFILSGSEQFELIETSTQSLAGRTALLKLLPLTLAEVSRVHPSLSENNLLLSGFLPRIHNQQQDPLKALKNYYETYIERDLRQMIHLKDLSLFQKFIRLCAGRTGQLFVASHLATEVGVSVPTIQAWISILETSYIVFFLQPYYENISKRLVKSPKLYFYDVGLATYLLGIETLAQLERDPLRGSLFENMVVMDLVKTRFNQGLDHRLYFYRDSGNHEVDVLFKEGHTLVPIEIKSTQTFRKDLLKELLYLKKILPHQIERGALIYAGKAEQTIDFVSLLSFKNVAGTLQPL